VLKILRKNRALVGAGFCFLVNVHAFREYGLYYFFVVLLVQGERQQGRMGRVSMQFSSRTRESRVLHLFHFRFMFEAWFDSFRFRRLAAAPLVFNAARLARAKT
jgi:hypothetical protein